MNPNNLIPIHPSEFEEMEPGTIYLKVTHPNGDEQFVPCVYLWGNCSEENGPVTTIQVIRHGLSESEECYIERWFRKVNLDRNKDPFLLHLIDVVWNTCTESTDVPDTDWAHRMIAEARHTYKGDEKKPVIQFEGQAWDASAGMVRVTNKEGRQYFHDYDDDVLEEGKTYRVTVEEV